MTDLLPFPEPATGDGHTLVIVGCGKTKLPHAAPARDLYTGNLFRAARRWAERNGDTWRIASAAYGLVTPDRQLEPYDRTMRGLHRDYRRQWGAWAQCDLCEHFREHGHPRRVVLLAGSAYVHPLMAWTSLNSQRFDVETPLDGLGIGQRLSWFKARSQ